MRIFISSKIKSRGVCKCTNSVCQLRRKAFCHKGVCVCVCVWYTNDDHCAQVTYGKVLLWLAMQSHEAVMIPLMNTKYMYYWDSISLRLSVLSQLILQVDILLSMCLYVIWCHITVHVKIALKFFDFSIQY